MSGVPITYAERIKTLPPYLFAAIDEMKQQAVARGVDIINLGIGDPDLPTPDPILERMRQAVTDPRHHQYPSSSGMVSFRAAVAGWYQRRFHRDGGSPVRGGHPDRVQGGHRPRAHGLYRSGRRGAGSEPRVSRVSGGRRVCRRHRS